MMPHILFVVVHQSVVMSLSILGNLFLVFVILRGNHVSRRRISPVQLLLLHTCAADLLFSLLSLGTEILTMFTYPQFYGTDWMCKLMRYAQMLPHYASPFLLVAISADRYQAICRPLANFRASRYRRPNCLAAVAWTLSLVFSLPQIIVWTKKPRRNINGYECGTIYGHGPEHALIKYIYVLVFNAIAWLLPCILAGYFYFRVCKAVWMSGVTAPKATNEKTEITKGNQTQSYIDSLRKKSFGFRRQTSEFDRKRLHTVRLTMTIIVCNFFLWMPFCVVNVLLAVWPFMLSPSVYLYVMTLGNLNSCVNPWIYILFNRSHVVKAFSRKRDCPAYTNYKTEESRLHNKGSTQCSPKSSSDDGNTQNKCQIQRNVSFQGVSYQNLSAEQPSSLFRNRSMFGNRCTVAEGTLAISRSSGHSPKKSQNTLTLGYNDCGERKKLLDPASL